MIFVSKKVGKIKKMKPSIKVTSFRADKLKSENDILIDANYTSYDEITMMLKRAKVDTRDLVVDLDSKKCMKKFIKRNSDDLLDRIDKKIDKCNDYDDSLKHRQNRAIVVRVTTNGKNVDKKEMRKLILKYAKTPVEENRKAYNKLKKAANFDALERY